MDRLENVSGLKVNDSKTEICLFSRSDAASIYININGETVKTSKEIIVLGIVFDSKLQLGPNLVGTPSGKGTNMCQQST